MPNDRGRFLRASTLGLRGRPVPQSKLTATGDSLGEKRAIHHLWNSGEPNDAISIHATPH
jgi:hypothetical protein